MTGKRTGKAGRPADPVKDRTILEAARELLFGEGPQALTMDKVAEKAGISKVTVYARYANRHALLQAVISHEATQINQTLVHTPVNPGDLVADLTAFLDAGVSFLGSDRHKHLMLAISAIPQADSDLAEVYHNGPQRTQQQLAAYLRSAAEQGFIVCPSPLDSAEMLIGMSTGLDITRSLYRVPMTQRGMCARQTYVRRIVEGFLLLHAMPTQS